MKILVTGSNGLLGQKLIYKLIEEQDCEVIATSRGENRLIKKEGYHYEPLNIANQAEVEAVVDKYNPDVIINSAAMTNVDACEADKEACWSINVDAVQYFIEACEKRDIHLIHLSTDFIFDGKAGPYKEEDIPSPLSYYGESKYEAEKRVQASKIKWTIIRTVLVYGVVDNMSRSNIVLWAKNALKEQQSISVVDDQYRTPTLAEDLADGCILAARKSSSGIYHISGKDMMSILELVNRVAAFYQFNTDSVSKVSSETLNQPAKRPPITGFVIEKAINNLGYQPHSFEDGLKIVEQQLEEISA